MDESRKQFEQEFARRYKFPCQFDRHEKSGEYANVRVRASWRMWVASRAAIEIGIPSRINNVDLRTPLEVEDMWRDRMKSTLRAAGIKVKE